MRSGTARGQSVWSWGNKRKSSYLVVKWKEDDKQRLATSRSPEQHAENDVPTTATVTATNPQLVIKHNSVGSIFLAHVEKLTQLY